MFELDYTTDVIYGFLNTHANGVLRVEGSRGFALRKNGVVIAAVIFEQYNGHSVWMHVAGGADGWLTRGFLRHVLCYAFDVCKVGIVRGMVQAGNARMRRLAKRLGGVQEAVLRGGGESGDDVVILALYREKAKYDTLALL